MTQYVSRATCMWEHAQQHIFMPAGSRARYRTAPYSPEIHSGIHRELYTFPVIDSGIAGTVIPGRWGCDTATAAAADAEFKTILLFERHVRYSTTMSDFRMRPGRAGYPCHRKRSNISEIVQWEGVSPCFTTKGWITKGIEGRTYYYKRDIPKTMYSPVISYSGATYSEKNAVCIPKTNIPKKMQSVFRKQIFRKKCNFVFRKQCNFIFRKQIFRKRTWNFFFIFRTPYSEKNDFIFRKKLRSS